LPHREQFKPYKLPSFRHCKFFETELFPGILFCATNFRPPLNIVESIHEFNLISVQDDFFIIFQLLEQPGNNHSGCSQFLCNQLMGRLYKTGTGKTLLFFKAGDQSLVQFMECIHEISPHLLQPPGLKV
jgi:hypothetical protein